MNLRVRNYVMEKKLSECQQGKHSNYLQDLQAVARAENHENIKY